MDTHDLTAALQALNPKDYKWRFCLYSTHKSKDGTQLAWNACAMKDIAAFTEKIASNLLEKTLTTRSVTEYAPSLPKEEIGTVPTNDPLVRQQMSDLFSSVRNAETHAPEDFANGIVGKPVGYGFWGEAEANKKQVLFLRRANPFLAAAKGILAIGKSGTVQEAEAPLLKFTPQADFLVIENVCVFLSDSVSKDLDLQSRAEAVCNRRLNQLEETDILSNLDLMRLAAATPKLQRRFLDFDREVMEHIAGLSIAARQVFISPFGIDLNTEGKLECGTAEQCGQIIDLLCGRVCFDALGRLAVGKEIEPIA
jgi:hypothetical protein